MILTKIAGRNFISFSGEISNIEAIKEVSESDVIVCPSRDDPFPVVLVEGFCMARTCIVSDATGFAELIKEDVSGFVFKSENAEALANIIRKIVLNPSQIDTIGKKAREIYLKELSIPVLKERLLGYMNALPEPEKDKTQTRTGDQRVSKPTLAKQAV
jgi:glycosyltransferase involved in cell wall biosynthesis